MQKVVFVRSRYPDVRVDKEAKSLVNRGYSITFLAWDRRKNSTIEHENYIAQLMKLPVSPGSTKVIFFLPIWWSYVIYYLLITKWDIVHATDFDSYFPSLIVSKIKRKIIFYDIFDFYADMMGFPIFPKFSRYLFSRVDKFLMKFSNAVIIADNSRILQIGENANKCIITINNSPKDIEISSFPKRNNKEFTISYGGMVSESRGIIHMIETIKGLEGVSLTIMGPCYPYDFEDTIRSKCEYLNNVNLVLNVVPYHKILEITSNADLLFAIYDPKVKNNIFASPNKLFEAMMFAKPIIVNDGTPMAKIVHEENCGIVVPYGDIDALTDSILKLKDSPTLCKKYGLNGRKAYETKYSWEVMEKRLMGLYSKLPRN